MRLVRYYLINKSFELKNIYFDSIARRRFNILVQDKCEREIHEQLKSLDITELSARLERWLRLINSGKVDKVQKNEIEYKIIHLLGAIEAWEEMYIKQQEHDYSNIELSIMQTK